MRDYEAFKPIRNFGIGLATVGGLGIVGHFLSFHDPDYIIGVQVFVVSVSIFYLFSGISIVSRKSWGFKNLKLCLYLLYPGFPLGYYFAKSTFKYIEANEIEKYFKKSITI
jgi:hypothetical protein